MQCTVDLQATARSFGQTQRCGWTVCARPPLPSKLFAWVKPRGSMFPLAYGAAQHPMEIDIHVRVWHKARHVVNMTACGLSQDVQVVEQIDEDGRCVRNHLCLRSCLRW